MEVGFGAGQGAVGLVEVWAGKQPLDGHVACPYLSLPAPVQGRDVPAPSPTQGKLRGLQTG